MAQSSKMSAQKRARERKRLEQAELKRAKRRNTPEGSRGGQVADRADLDSYGVPAKPSDTRDDP